jgi:hypothetical protein
MAAETLIIESTDICHITGDAHVELHRHNSKSELSFSFLFYLVVFLGY